MQKFGWDSLQSQRHGALELEIVKEQATALGIAGKKLRLAIEAFESGKARGFPGADEAALLRAVSESVFALLLQRELVGFTEGNLEWIRKHYAIPDEAIATLGAAQGR